MGGRIEPAQTSCPNCGGNFVTEWNPPAYWIRCDSCEWEALTSKFPEILEDLRDYNVSLRLGVGSLGDEIRTLKKYLNVTTVAARKLVSNRALAPLFTEKAPKAAVLIAELQELNLEVLIEPPFSWTVADLHKLTIR